MKKETKAKLEKYQATLEEAVKAGTKLNTARKALLAIPHVKKESVINAALLEITDSLSHYNSVIKNTMHNIAVLELKEGI